MGKLTLDQYRSNITSMLNLLEDANTKFPSGETRDLAYSHIGQELLGDANAFADLA